MQNICITLQEGICDMHITWELPVSEPMGKGNKHTNSIRDSIFKHTYIPNPTITLGDAFIVAGDNSANALKGKIIHYLKE